MIHDFVFWFKREMRLFWKNPIMKVLYLGGPILYGALFGAVYQKGKVTGLPLVVVNKDQSPMSDELVDLLSEVEALSINEIKYEPLNLHEVLMAQKAYAVVIIPVDFERDLLRGYPPEVNTYINNANILPANYAYRALATAIGTFSVMKTVASGRKVEAVHLNTFRLFNPSSNYFLFIWPSYLAIILQSVVMVVLALSFAAEREMNTHQHSIPRRTSVIPMMFGKLTLYWLLGGIILFIYGLYFVLFKQTLPLRIYPLLMVSLLFIVSNSFIGMIAGLLFKSQLRSLQFLMVLSMPIYIASGFSWPLDQGGWESILFSSLFPFMPFVNGLRILLIENGQLGDISDYLLLQLVQLILYILIAFCIVKIQWKAKST